MPSIRHKLPYWQVAAFAVLAALWVALSILWLLGRGDVETYLLATFKNSVRADAFRGLNSAFQSMWISHTCLLVFCFVAMVAGMSDLFIVLILGPTLALLVAFATQQWDDPHWFIFAGVCSIGCTVGIVVGGAYCGCLLLVRTKR